MVKESGAREGEIHLSGYAALETGGTIAFPSFLLDLVVRVVHLLSPSAKVLRLGDEILAVNGQSLQGLPHEEAVQQLRECSGPAVTLRVRPNQTLEGGQVDLCLPNLSPFSLTHFYTSLSLSHAWLFPFRLHTDIFSSESSQHQPDLSGQLAPPWISWSCQFIHPHMALTLLSPSTASPSMSFTEPLATPPTCSAPRGWREEGNQRTGPLPRGWTEKVDHKTGRPYFEK